MWEVRLCSLGCIPAVAIYAQLHCVRCIDNRTNDSPFCIHQHGLKSDLWDMCVFGWHTCSSVFNYLALGDRVLIYILHCLMKSIHDFVFLYHLNQTQLPLSNQLSLWTMVLSIWHLPTARGFNPNSCKVIGRRSIIVVPHLSSRWRCVIEHCKSGTPFEPSLNWQGLHS